MASISTTTTNDPREEPREIVTYEDDPLRSLPAGRIALYANRLIATFDSLEVTPLTAEE